MSFLGKEYTFEKQENFEELVKVFGLSPERSQALINTHPNQKLVKDGDTYRLIGHSEVVFKCGVPFEENVTGDLKAQTVFNLEGNTLRQLQKFQDGAEFNYTRVYGDDQLVVTMKYSKYNGTATRYYKAV